MTSAFSPEAWFSTARLVLRENVAVFCVSIRILHDQQL